MARLAQEHDETEYRLSELPAGHVPPLELALALPPRAYQIVAAQTARFARPHAFWRRVRDSAWVDGAHACPMERITRV